MEKLFYLEYKSHKNNQILFYAYISQDYSGLLQGNRAM
jgi:hypothetical protein